MMVVKRARILRSLVLCAALAGLAAGCSEEEERKDPVVVENTDPISVDRTQRSFGYFVGDATFISAASATSLTEAFEHVTFRVQLIDELNRSRPGGTLENSRFAARLDALIDEAQGALTVTDEVVVLDLMRLSDGQRAGSPTPYLLSWDDTVRPIENYGFWRAEYRNAVLAQIEAAARAQKPAYFVVGAEMDRLLDMPGGASDYANFVTFFREAYATIKRESPETRVGAGLDWLRLVQDRARLETLSGSEIPASLEVEPGLAVDCAPFMASDPATDDTTRDVRRACMDKTFLRYVEPLLRQPVPVEIPAEGAGTEIVLQYVRTADVLALAALGTNSDFGNSPATAPEDLLATLRPWSQEFPVAWYEINWRVSGPVGAAQQNAWIRTLIARSGGVRTELLSWGLLKDLTSNDCTKLTTDLGAPASVCYAGMWTSSTAPKDVYDTFVTDIAAP